MNDADLVDFLEPEAVGIEVADLPMPAGIEMRDYQEVGFKAFIEARKQATRILVVMCTGGGKCLGRGTPVMLYDGTVRPVEEIKEGDLLMGPDSAPRRVDSVCSGREMLYRVTPIKGDSYVVNESHILSLQITNMGRNAKAQSAIGIHRGGDVVNIGVRDYLASGEWFHHVAKGWRAAVDFQPTRLHPDLPAYMLGLWLGDGSASTFAISKPDPEVLDSVNEYAASIGHKVITRTSPHGCPTHFVTSPDTALRGRGHKPNMATNALADLGLLRNRHIPMAYKTASASDRLSLLAGILDSDGSLGNNGYDFISIVKRLSEDVAFLARSLGMAAYIKPCVKKCQTGATSQCWRVSISGSLDRIPMRIPRKKAQSRGQIKSVLRTGIKVEPIGVGDYFGFSLSGNDRLFLLGDFTVTHNTVLFSKLTDREVNHLRGRVLILAHSEELLDQARDKLLRATGIKADLEKAENQASPDARVVVASIQTLSKTDRLTGFADDHFSLVIVDETHRVLSPSYLKVVNYFHFGEASLDEGWTMPIPGEPYKAKSVIAGFTATAMRGDRRNLGEFFQVCAFDYGLKSAVLDGYLVRPIVKNIPLKIDLRRRKADDKVFRGNDVNQRFVDERLMPLMKEIAAQFKEHASDRKTVAFLPSIESARRLAEACREVGLDAEFVSGECKDRAEKVQAFAKKGRGSLLANAMLLAEGWDCADVSCVSMLRATKLPGLFTQCAGRGTRTLPGVIDGLKTKAERLAAIAASAKPNLLLLDPLWLSDSLSLVSPVDLIASRPEVRERMAVAAAAGATDLLNMELSATHELIVSLEKAARKHARKAARVIDPLTFSAALGDDEMALYEPQTEWERLPATEPQLAFLRKQHIDTTSVKYRGHAQMLTVKILSRYSGRMATPLQLNFMRKLGIASEEAAKMTSKEASAACDAIIADRKARYPAPCDLPE